MRTPENTKGNESWTLPEVDVVWGGMVKMLSRRGHKVTHANLGKEALGVAEKQKIDLLISDIGISDMNGWHLLGQLRAVQPDLRAIAVSGYKESDKDASSDYASFNVHLIKPVEFSKVEAATAKLFNG